MIKKCRICKKEFEAKINRTFMCSKECKKEMVRIQSLEYLNIKKIPRWEVFNRDNYTCTYCGRNVKEDNIKLEVDHILSVVNGGSNKLNNLTTVCRECNREKSDKYIV